MDEGREPELIDTAGPELVTNHVWQGPLRIHDAGLRVACQFLRSGFSGFCSDLGLFPQPVMPYMPNSMVSASEYNGYAATQYNRNPATGYRELNHFCKVGIPFGLTIRRKC